MKYGKFDTAEQLFTAYLNLEKEFTKKCQKVTELDKIVSSIGDQNNALSKNDKVKNSNKNSNLTDVKKNKSCIEKDLNNKNKVESSDLPNQNEDNTISLKDKSQNDKKLDKVIDKEKSVLFNADKSISSSENTSNFPLPDKNDVCVDENNVLVGESNVCVDKNNALVGRNNICVDENNVLANGNNDLTEKTNTSQNFDANKQYSCSKQIDNESSIYKNSGTSTVEKVTFDIPPQQLYGILEKHPIVKELVSFVINQSSKNPDLFVGDDANKNCIELVSQLILSKIKDNTDLMGKYVLGNTKLCDNIFASYLDKICLAECPNTIAKNGGGMPMTLPIKPKNLTEASKLTERMLR